MVDFDVVELPPTDHPSVGDTAPDFTRPLVTDEYWQDTALSDLVGPDPTVLVFHPMDGSFPATYVWKAIAERQWENDATVVGLSISTPYEHADFIADRELDSPLFSDPSNAVAESYGIVHDLDGMTGLSEPRPAVFLLDADRTIQHAWVASEWPDFPEYDDIEASLQELI